MVTKVEVKEHYASQRVDPNVGYCSPFVERYLEKIPEDENGIYSPVNEQLFGGDREYLTLDEVKRSIRAALKQYITDLEKVAEI